MRIISEAEYNKECHRCYSTLAVMASDLKMAGFGLGNYVECPICDAHVFISKDDLKKCNKIKD